MAPRHTIDKLEPEVRALIKRLLKRPRGVDEFMALTNRILEETGSEVRVSRSSAHRWMQDFEDERKALRETQEISRAFASEFGEIPDTDAGHLLEDMLHAVILKVLRPYLTGKGAGPEPKDVMMLARSLRDTTSARKVSVELEMKIRATVAKEHAAKLDAATEEAAAAGEPGLSAERVEQLRRDFLGVRS